MIMRKQRIKIVSLLALCFIILTLSISYSALATTLSFDSSAIIVSPIIDGTCKLVNEESVVFGSYVLCGNESFHVVGRDDTNNTFVLAGDYPVRTREPYNQIVYSDPFDYLTNDGVYLEETEGKMDVDRLASLYRDYLQNILKLENISVSLLNNDSFVGYNDGTMAFVDTLDSCVKWIFGTPTFTAVTPAFVSELAEKINYSPPPELFLGILYEEAANFVSIEEYNDLLNQYGLDGFPIRFTITIPQDYIIINGGE